MNILYPYSRMFSWQNVWPPAAMADIWTRVKNHSNLFFGAYALKISQPHPPWVGRFQTFSFEFLILPSRVYTQYLRYIVAKSKVGRFKKVWVRIKKFFLKNLLSCLCVLDSNAYKVTEDKCKVTEDKRKVTEDKCKVM